MERKKFITIIGKRKDLDESLVRGVIMGIEHTISNYGGKHYCHFIEDKYGRTHMIHEATSAEYSYFEDKVEAFYPGLCEFNI